MDEDGGAEVPLLQGEPAEEEGWEEDEESVGTRNEDGVKEGEGERAQHEAHADWDAEEAPAAREALIEARQEVAAEEVFFGPGDEAEVDEEVDDEPGQIAGALDAAIGARGCVCTEPKTVGGNGSVLFENRDIEVCRLSELEADTDAGFGSVEAICVGGQRGAEGRRRAATEDGAGRGVRGVEADGDGGAGWGGNPGAVVLGPERGVCRLARGGRGVFEGLRPAREVAEVPVGGAAEELSVGQVEAGDEDREDDRGGAESEGKTLSGGPDPKKESFAFRGEGAVGLTLA